MTGADKHRLRQVRAAILGNRPDKSLSNALYPVYVAAIAAGSYGVPAAQQMFRSLDGQWLAAHAWTPVGAMVTGTIAVLLMTFVRLVGRVHGPVVPPLPYLELVVASPMPRKVTLARHWRLSLGGSVAGGLLVGLVVGAGLAIAEVVSPTVLLPATLGGGLFGVLFAEVWLRGQVHGSRRDTSAARGRRNALALLDMTSLRRQAASNVTIGGAVLAGDLRMVRLDAARPIKRARRVRLRASTPLAVIARRDLLGMRRAPGSALYGLVLAAIGTGGLMLSLQSPRTPTMAPLVSLVFCYLGFGTWCEGLRLHADNSGTSRLMGLPYRDTAIGHLVVPVSAWALTTLVVSAPLSLTGLVTTPAPVIWALGTGALLTGAHLMAAFRGLPPISIYGPNPAPALVIWYARPLLATLIVGTAMAAFAVRAATAWTVFSWMMLASAVVVRS